MGRRNQPFEAEELRCSGSSLSFFGNGYFETLVNPEWNCSIVGFFPWICTLVHHQWKVSFGAEMNLLSCCIVFLVLFCVCGLFFILQSRFSRN
ncbi:hypothetical protein L6452_10016 [Arctium lappa]|uniref:Uncharacterized protein n=1 Tax=Arctium lappa TaxID=4217 RepID=A0ACB9DM38_ARCLA|nr:hypothetical protein L6452_10016 [Arctium lappa]